jgi:hypothetical protein
MGNLSTIRPWFCDELEKILTSNYFSMRASGNRNQEYLRGYITALIGLALAIGINPKSILMEEDMRLLEVRNVQ